MKRPTLPMIALGLTFAVSGALFAQSHRTGDRTSRTPSSWGSGATGPIGTLPGITADSPQPGKPLPGDFEILAHKSIFEKDRHRYIPRSEAETRTVIHDAPLPPAVHVPGIPVLVGVIIGDDGLIAYIEDPDSGKLWPLAPEDPLPMNYGYVKNITLDEIEIAKDSSSSRHILIGQNLAGDAPPPPSTTDSVTPAFPSTSVASSQPDSGSTTAPAIDPTTAGLTIEQKMKLKRQQQLGK